MPHKLPYKEYLQKKLPLQAERFLLRLYPYDPQRREVFLEALLSGNCQAPALLWLVDRPDPAPFATIQRAPWQPDWVDALADSSVRPSHNVLYAEGAYYPMDFSSVSTASAMVAITEHVETVLDVCSAPGGKAIFSWRALHPTRLLCNEVIGKRHRSLHGNLERCHVPGELLQQDTSRLVENYSAACDVVLVDAPCSGQSLIARGDEVSGAFQDHMINMNMGRQRRILAYSKDCVRPGGYLVYSTCTYAREENEKNVEWLLKRFPDFHAMEVPHLREHQSTLLDQPCYRIEPQQGLGAGGFVALFKRQD